MNEEKKKYLSLYLLQHARVIGICEKPVLLPEDIKIRDKEIERAEMLRAEIEEKINAVDGATLSELLFLKYVCGKSLMEISYILNYSVRHTERLHRKALELFRI